MDICEAVKRQFTDELQVLLNKYGVDALVGIHDFVLAHTIERILNTLAWQYNQELRLIGSGQEDIIL